MSNFDKQLLSSNLVRAGDLDQLKEREQLITDAKTRDIIKNPIRGNFDYKHLKDIHKALFDDIYVWAGMDRYEIGLRGQFSKGESNFTKGSALPDVAKILFDELKKENYFKDYEKSKFIRSLASFMNGLNILHPFREGNGRTQRIFLEQLAKSAGYNLNLSIVSKDIMIQASIQGSKGNIKGLEIIIRDYIN